MLTKRVIIATAAAALVPLASAELEEGVFSPLRLSVDSQAYPPLKETLLWLDDNAAHCYFSNDRGGQDDHKALAFKVGLWSVPQMTNIICPKTGAKGKFKIRFDKTGLNPLRRLDKSTFRDELARLNSAAIKLNYRRESDTEVRALDKNIEQMGPAGKETVARMRDVCWAAIRVIEKSYPTHDSLCDKYGKGM